MTYTTLDAAKALWLEHDGHFQPDTAEELHLWELQQAHDVRRLEALERLANAVERLADTVEGTTTTQHDLFETFGLEV